MSASLHVLAALKATLRAHVLASPDIAALIGSAFHDMAQKSAHPPFLAFGDAAVRDNSTQNAPAAIIELELIALTHERGTSRGMALLAALEAALDAPLPPLTGHRLVALERPEARIRHDSDTNLVRVSYRLRAYTESL